MYAVSGSAVHPGLLISILLVNLISCSFSFLTCVSYMYFKVLGLEIRCSKVKTPSSLSKSLIYSWLGP